MAITPQKRIAIMGGTFDPIHMGHLVTAEAVRHEFDIDEVIFVPTGNPPHKDNVNVTSAEHRYLMTALATAGNVQFQVSRIEIDRIGTTYTIDTIKELKETYGKDSKLYFITGADAVQQILTWKNSEELLTLCTFVAVTRPGYDKSELMDKVEELRRQYGSAIQFLEVPALSISSSDIRNRVKENRPIKYLVVGAVETYIQKHRLYAHPLTIPQDRLNVLTNYVKQCISRKRYEHTKGVIERAIELANLHGVDVDKAYLAALFHDVAKELSVEQIQNLCKHYEVTMDDFEMHHLDISHGKLGAALLEGKWGLHDEDILNSIRYHTVGRENMSDLEMIIYLADMTERGRKPFTGLEKIRRLSEVDLNKAMYEAFLSTKEYVTEVLHKEVHPLTDTLIKAYQVYDSE